MVPGTVDQSDTANDFILLDALCCLLISYTFTQTSKIDNVSKA